LIIRERRRREIFVESHTQIPKLRQERHIQMMPSDDAAPDGACVTTGFGATKMPRRWRSENSSKMKSATKYSIVLVTAPDLKTARALAKAALSARLIACANLVPKIESHYWWRGKIESGAEVLLVLKTQKSKLEALEKLILAQHPYDTPEFIVLPLSAGNKKYLDWLKSNCGNGL
jgi:periplasmic divalent cation tolerance protein